jgi:hypothetical protein
MRYYVFKIFYNKVAKAEDRPQPSGYDSLDEALKAYHAFMQQSILSETCGWCLCMVVNEYGKAEVTDRWEATETPTTEATEE